MKTVADVLGACTGCGACYSVCKADAISFFLDENGFYTAKVDRDKCVSCGLCCKVCTKNSGDLMENTLQSKSVYAAATKDTEALARSTSGAVAYELSKYCLQNGYCVLGAAYDSEENTCRTVFAEDEEGLKKLQGSKYMQSDTSAAFKEALAAAQKDKDQKYLVFGTPCQIYGLCKALQLKKLRDRFLCVELFCHGVPSKILIDRYLEEKRPELGGKIKRLQFRDKKYGWHMYTVSLQGEGKTLYETSDRSDFYKMYFDHTVMNRACIKCPYRKGASLADIRLGDFWGKKGMDNDTGISAVLLLSPKGRQLWDRLKDKLQVFGQFPSESCLSNQSIYDYRETSGELQKNIDDLKSGMPLKKVIRRSRKAMPLKRRARGFAKDVFAVIPNEWKISLKKTINRIRSKG